MFYVFIFREGKGGRRRGKQCVVASCVPPTGYLPHKPDMCLDWESNQGPFGHRPTLNLLSHTCQGLNKVMMSVIVIKS